MMLITRFPKHTRLGSVTMTTESSTNTCA